MHEEWFHFLDEDEDGDRITVRSDDEQQAMINWVSTTPLRDIVALKMGKKFKE